MSEGCFEKRPITEYTLDGEAMEIEEFDFPRERMEAALFPKPRAKLRDDLQERLEKPVVGAEKVAADTFTDALLEDVVFGVLEAEPR